MSKETKQLHHELQTNQMVISDISARKETENALEIACKELAVTKIAEDNAREYAESFIIMANNISQLAWMADAQGSIFWFNQRWFDYTGATLLEMSGRGWQKVLHPDHVQRVVEKLKHSFTTGEVWEDTFPLRGADGRYRWFLSRAVPIRDGQGRVTRWFGTNTDITAEKQAEAELREINYRLETTTARANEMATAAAQANRAKSYFLSVMSHELRTPLNAIIGFSEIMIEGMAGMLTAQQTDYLQDIYNAGGHLLSLINDILDLAKIEAGKLELEKSDFHCGNLVERSLVMFKEKAFQHRIKLSAEGCGAIGEICADERKIKQVLFNIIGNAFKFTPDGGSILVQARAIRGGQIASAAGQLSPCGNKGGNFIEIAIADTGIGIAGEDVEKLFKAFSQVGNNVKKKEEGTGLGLSICRQIVELHGGEIRGESDGLGKGSRFVITLPGKESAEEKSAEC